MRRCGCLVVMALVLLFACGILSSCYPGPPPDTAICWTPTAVGVQATVEALAATQAVEIHAATAEAVTGEWQSHIDEIQTEVAHEQEEWRRARGH